MNRCFLIGICFLTGLILTTPVHSATYDMTGNYQCIFSGGWAHGDVGCQTGPNPSSSCTIAQTGDSFSLVLNSACDPAFTCTFDGTVSGSTYTGSNTGPLDEGGTVVNSTVFTALSSTNAVGSYIANASFPDWQCNWGFDSVVLTRIDNPNPDKYTLTVNVNGSGSVTRDPEGGVYNPGTSVTLTAIPDSEWQFDFWAGDTEGGQNPVVIVMDKNKTVTAIITRSKKSVNGTLHLLLRD